MSPAPETPRNRPTTEFHRLPKVGLSCAAVLLLGLALAQSQPPNPPAPPQTPAPPNAPPGRQTSPGAEKPAKTPSARAAADGPLREGAELTDQHGTFKLAGDRAVFFLAGGRQQLIGLENLNLERIVRVITDNPGPLDWTVSGTITEYRGGNFLLVRRATFKIHGQGGASTPATPTHGGAK